MNPGRMIVLVIAIAAALGAALMVRKLSSRDQAPDARTVTEAAPEPQAGRVLVARKDIPVGHRVTPEDLGWQEWPIEAINKAFLTQKKDPKALETYSGAVARMDIAAGEPLSPRKLVNPGEAGFMAAVLAPGMRAVSVEISAETGAGGFILPNDRVDVLLTEEQQAEDSGQAQSVHNAKTILDNVRVLAIDQTFRHGGGKDGKDKEEVVIGSTATLELNRADAELLARAQASGQLSLALRSIADAVPGDEDSSRSHATRQTGSRALVVYRYGQPARLALKDQ